VSLDDDWPVPIAAEIPVLVPEGFYVAVCLAAEKPYEYYGKERLAVRFELLEGPGPEDRSVPHGLGRGSVEYQNGRGEVVKRHFTVVTKEGRIGSGGKGTDYQRMWTGVNGGPPVRIPRMSPNIFVGKYFLVEVGTAKSDHRGKDLERIHWYSVVRGVPKYLPNYDAAKECGELPF